MSVLPQSRQAMLQFFEQHVTVWAASPTAIGLTAAQMTQLATYINDARTSFDAQQDAIAVKLAATNLMYTKTDTLRSFGADLIKTIRAFAETTNNPDVYSDAQIPPPKTPTPVGPPETPTEITATINNFGYIVVKWKGRRAAGTQFILQRQLAPLAGKAGNWTYAGTTTTNDYTDITVPTGYASVSYRVYAQRSGGQSDASTPVTLQFGTDLGENTATNGDGLSLAA